MSQRHLSNARIGLLLIVMLGLGAFLAYCYITMQGQGSQNSAIPDSVDSILSNFKVLVADTNETFNFTIKDPFTRVIFWRQSGTVLNIVRANVNWQIVVGQEDAPYQGKGDSCDVILKLYEWSDTGKIGYEIACLGGYNKKVWYANMLLLDTTTGARYSSGSLPS